MLLVCDIGNTNFKYGLYRGNKLIKYGIIKNSSLDFSEIDKLKFSEVAFSSVVPYINNKLKKHLKNNYSIFPFEVIRESKLNISIDYKSPETLGIDRICSAEGMMSKFILSEGIYSKNTFLISIDFGTATTINLIEPIGRFTGGLIAPGIELMFQSLNRNTANLPLASIVDFTSSIGMDTKSSIAAGIVASTIGLINYFCDAIRTNNKKSIINIFLTGGNARLIMPYLKYETFYYPDLVLFGVKKIFELNRKKNDKKRIS